MELRYFTAEETKLKVGKISHAADPDAAKAAAAGKAVAKTLGPKAIGNKKLNVLMMVQVPLKQKPAAVTRGGFIPKGGCCSGSAGNNSKACCPKMASVGNPCDATPPADDFLDGMAAVPECASPCVADDCDMSVSKGGVAPLSMSMDDVPVPMNCSVGGPGVGGGIRSSRYMPPTFKVGKATAARLSVSDDGPVRAWEGTKWCYRNNSSEEQSSHAMR